jgi:hypothetical protein
LGFDISEEQVKLELAAEKTRKVTMQGSVHLKMLKYGRNKIITLLTKLYREIMQGGKIQGQMKLEYTSSMHKKGHRRPALITEACV